MHTHRRLFRVLVTVGMLDTVVVCFITHFSFRGSTTTPVVYSSSLTAVASS